MRKTKQLELLSGLGFTIPVYRTFTGDQMDDDSLTDLTELYKKNSPFALDGLVLEIDDETKRKRLGLKNKNPEYARKFKITANDNTAQATVVRVIWNVSKLAFLKPRVEIKPVELNGVTITYLTGFNAKFIKENGIGTDAVIQITRSGDVIPYIQKIITPVVAVMPTEEEFGTMYWTDGEVDLYLENDTDESKLRRIVEFFSAIEVPQLKRGNLEKLYEEGYDTLEKIIKASEGQLKSIVGDANGEKIHAGIKSKLTNIPQWLIVGASQMFGKGIGKRRIKKLYEKYGHLNLTHSDIKATETFDEKTATVVVEGLVRVNEFLKNIEGYYSFAIPVDDKVEKINLFVCFTGVRSKELEAKIPALGGTILSGVNDKITHLVVKDINSTSSKMKKAQELGLILGETIITLEVAEKLWS